jgi:hypothetical protein
VTGNFRHANSRDATHFCGVVNSAPAPCEKLRQALEAAETAKGPRLSRLSRRAQVPADRAGVRGLSPSPPLGRGVPEAEAVHLEEEVGGGGRAAAAHAAGGGPRAALQTVAEAGAAGAEAGAADARVEAEAAADAAGARDVDAGEREVAVDVAAAGVGELAVLVGEAPCVLTLRDAAGAELGDLVAGEGERAGRGGRARGTDCAPGTEARGAAGVGGGARELLAVAEEGDVGAPAARGDGEHRVLGAGLLGGGRDARLGDALVVAVLDSPRDLADDLLHDLDELEGPVDADADGAQAPVDGLDDLGERGRKLDDEVGDGAQDRHPEVVDDPRDDLAIKERSST